jgi:2-polyprenyl-3-methyl-5-hydroxy-6-metoxy-1,4-benzoquinol methylase
VEFATEVIDLDIGSRHLSVEQLANLDAIARVSVIAGQTGTDRPFWAYLWPSARSLAGLIGRLPDLSGKRVMDLGSGVGAVGLAAAARGATVVLADIREEAASLGQKNAVRNGLAVETRVFDWDHPPTDLGEFDGITAADVFYDDGMMRGVLRFMRHHLKKDGLAWIADPMRIQPGGVAGAARLNGFECTSTILVPGQTMTGGVTLYEFWRRPRILVNSPT